MFFFNSFFDVIWLHSKFRFKFHMDLDLYYQQSLVYSPFLLIREKKWICVKIKTQRFLYRFNMVVWQVRGVQALFISFENKLNSKSTEKMRFTSKRQQNGNIFSKEEKKIFKIRSVFNSHFFFFGRGIFFFSSHNIIRLSTRNCIIRNSDLQLPYNGKRKFIYSNVFNQI